MSLRRKSLFFYLEQNSPWLNSQIKKALSLKEEIIIVYSHDIPSEFQQEKSIKKLKFDELISLELSESPLLILIKFVQNLSKTISMKENNLLHYFSYNKYNLWWFVPRRLFSFLRDNNSLVNIIIISKMLEKFSPNIIYSAATNDFNDILRSICTDKKCQFETNESLFQQKKRQVQEILVHKFAGWKWLLLYKRLAKWSRKNAADSQRVNHSLKKLLFLSHPIDIRREFDSRGTYRLHNIYQDSFQQILNKNPKYELITLEITENFAQCKILETAHKELKTTLKIPLFYYYDQKIHRMARMARKYIGKQLKRFFKEKAVKKAFEFMNVSLVDVFINSFLRQFKAELTASVVSLQLFTKALQDLKPAVVVLHNEFSIFGKAVCLIAFEKGIPTIAIQHGIINFAAKDYLIYKEMICDNDDKIIRSHCSHHPSITAVYGKRTRQFLIREGGYSKHRVIITGCARWDFIYNYRKSFDRSQFLNTLHVNPDKKIIAVLSQALPNKKNRLYFNEKVSEVVGKFKDYQIIWKPHPREEVSSINGIIEKMALDNVIISKKISLYELLNACEVMITAHSTTALEAMLFDKAVVTFLPPAEEENDLFKNSNAVLKATTEKELEEAISSLLTNEKTRKDLANYRKKLLDELVLFDGKAAERIARLIMKLGG